jgi:ubiquinone/menaquinone biosynthesis C-methylase UbiE
LTRVARGARSRLRTVLRRAGRLTGLELHRPSESRRYWEDRAGRYRDEVRSILDPSDPYFLAQQEFVAGLGRFEWSSILEVGCGFGWHLRAVHGAFPGRRAAGVDFSAAQLVQAREHAGEAVWLAQAAAGALPFPSDAFDVVFTSGLLVCIHPNAIDAVMRELVRVARRSVITLEYAREHIVSAAARETMEGAAWHAHTFSEIHRRAGLRIVAAAPFASFAADPDRVPLSSFHGVKDPPVA